MKTKILKNCDIELKGMDDKQGVVEFYFAAFGVDLEGDKILPTAYTKTLSESRSRIYHNRDHGDAVGKPLSFGMDEKGAYAVSQLAIKTIKGRDMFEQYQAGIVKGHSQEFQTILSDTEEIDGQRVRVIKELRLWGLTSVTKIPANLDTPMISMKSAEDAADHLAKINKLLTTGHISDELGERLMTEFKTLSEIIEKKSAAIEDAKKPKGIDFEYLVKNL